MRIKLLIFDFDGTLGDTRGIIVTTMRQTMREMELPVPDEPTCAATIGLPLKECYRKMSPDVSDAILDRCADTHHRLFDQNMTRMAPRVFPGVRETLDLLHSQGFLLTVASSRSKKSLLELLDIMQIGRFFQLVLGADDVRKAKPDPEPVLHTLRQMSVSPDETLVVGDMAVDIMMGNGAGCQTCGVTYGNGSRDELAKAGAQLIIDHIGELPSLLSAT